MMHGRLGLGGQRSGRLQVGTTRRGACSLELEVTVTVAAWQTRPDSEDHDPRGGPGSVTVQLSLLSVMNLNVQELACWV